MADRKIGKRIEEVRKKHGESQKTLAELLGKSQSGISAMEKEDKQIMLQDIIKICEHYNVSADYIILGKERTSDLGLSPEGEKLYEEYLQYLREKHPREPERGYKRIENL